MRVRASRQCPPRDLLAAAATAAGANIREEEFAVTKAEAEAVEEMVRMKAIWLADELFLECNPRQG